MFSINIKILIGVLSAVIMLAHGSQLFAQTPPDESAPDATRTGSISGRVINETGGPIPNAAVVLRTVTSATPFQMRRAVTNRDGDFVIEGMEPGLYYGIASAAVHSQPAPDPNVPTTYYRLGDRITFVLAKGGVITGTVSSAAGEPLVGVNVRAVLVKDGNGRVPRNMAVQFGERSTDDRGVYRIYGLPAGSFVVAAGGRSSYGFGLNAFDSDSPTYASSATRDTAAEIEVRVGVETTSVDIRYRGEPGRIISGTVASPFVQLASGNNSLNLRRIRGSVTELAGFAFAPLGDNKFAFHGVADGEYDIEVMSTMSSSDVAASDPFPVVVKGSDVTGIVLMPKLLSSINGRILLESSNSPQCQNKRRPAFEEMLVNLQPIVEAKSKPAPTRFLTSAVSADKAGEFQLRSVRTGRYTLDAKFFAKYWFLRGLTTAVPKPVRGAAQSPDLSRTGLTVESGQRTPNLVVMLAEGAASLQGAVTPAEGQKLVPGSFVFLTPSENESANSPLRYYATELAVDGKFSFTNLAPGVYWIIVERPATDEPLKTRRLREPSQSERRLKMRREAEALKSTVELKPCQNVVDHKVFLKPS